MDGLWRSGRERSPPMSMITVETESERVVLEQALLAYRATRQAALTAEHGRGLEVTEMAALTEGRKVMSKLLEEVLQAHLEVGKRGQTLGRASGRSARVGGV